MISGDAMKYHHWYQFSTSDRDNDVWYSGECAADHASGWWHYTCARANLNGKYYQGGTYSDSTYSGIYWYDWQVEGFYSLKDVKMMVKPQ